MSGFWPRWATVRAEEVRTVLPPEEWGPWREGVECSRGIPAVFGLESTRHKSELPFFFHCRRCMVVNRRGETHPKPHPRRDMGLCIRCGEPAEELRDRVLLPGAAAQQAEARDITVARLCTRKFCAVCDPYSKPFCRGRECNKAVKLGGKRRRVEPACLCQPSRRAETRHCLVCCKAAASHHRRIRSVRGDEPPPVVEVEPPPVVEVEPSPLVNEVGQEPCKGKLCREAAKRGEPSHPVLPKGCCSQTKRHRPHCQRDHDRVREIHRASDSARQARAKLIPQPPRTAAA